MATSKSKQAKVSWVSGARLRTLPLAVAPIAVAWGFARFLQDDDLTLTLLALAVAVFLQIGVNFANDYSDGIRGTDAHRVGPPRLTATGAAKPSTVRNVAFGFFALAAVAGGAIVLLTGMWWLIAFGVVAILAAWFYTGGKNPYGYAGLGELFVFIFFGLAATLLTLAIQVQSFFSNPDTVIWSSGAAISVGLFASAVLMVNNIRDIDTDKLAGKRTLAVRVGKKWAKAIYFAMIWTPVVILVPYVLIFKATVLAFLVVFALLPLTLIVATARTPKELILALKLTSYSALGYALLLGFALGFNFA